jgi:hypothetical protein
MRVGGKWAGGRLGWAEEGAGEVCVCVCARVLGGGGGEGNVHA